jgi:hypothetical protein
VTPPFSAVKKRRRTLMAPFTGFRHRVSSAGYLLRRDQWLIIQGRAVGKLFAPLLVRFTSRDGLVEQQPQPDGCDTLYSPKVLGALALRSLMA